VAGRIVVVGDVMVDVAMRSPGPEASEPVLAAHGLPGGTHLLLTAHRAGNVDDPARLAMLVDLIAALPGPVVFPVHPRTRAHLQEVGMLSRLEHAEGVTVTESLGYVEFGALLRTARAVLTDSGGVQKEAYLAGVPCVTMRANTEWVETVQCGWNTLVDLDAEAALRALAAPTPSSHPQLYGDGHAAERCVRAIGEL
jgi:UDP-N-acetylglucosamine 2-epimerase (non-hydrolysing)/UDP-GlcNAc3NAcA epimerase